MKRVLLLVGDDSKSATCRCHLRDPRHASSSCKTDSHDRPASPSTTADGERPAKRPSFGFGSNTVFGGMTSGVLVVQDSAVAIQAPLRSRAVRCFSARRTTGLTRQGATGLRRLRKRAPDNGMEVDGDSESPSGRQVARARRMPARAATNLTLRAGPPQKLILLYPSYRSCVPFFRQNLALPAIMHPLVPFTSAKPKNIDINDHRQQSRLFRFTATPAS